MKHLFLAVILGLSANGAAAQPATTQPSDSSPPSTQQAPILVKVDDADGLKAAMGQDVILEGVVSKADWSGSGKVMQINFTGAEQTKVIAVVFEKNKDKFNEAFSGDLGKAIVGAKVRITGQLKDFKGKPEVVLAGVNQLTIIEPAGK